MILVVCHTMYIVICHIIYTCTYISLNTMTNKSVMTFISVDKISVCLSVCGMDASAPSASSRYLYVGPAMRQ